MFPNSRKKKPCNVKYLMPFFGFLNRVPGVQVPPGAPRKTKPRKKLRGFALYFSIIQYFPG
jgi:hypothetical protein